MNSPTLLYSIFGTKVKAYGITVELRDGDQYILSNGNILEASDLDYICYISLDKQYLYICDSKENIAATYELGSEGYKTWYSFLCETPYHESRSC